MTRSLSSEEAWHEARSTFIATIIRLPSIRLPDCASLNAAEHRSRLASIALIVGGIHLLGDFMISFLGRRIGGRRIVTRSLSSAEAWHKALSTFIATTIRLPSIRLPDCASVKDAEHPSRLASIALIVGGIHLLGDFMISFLGRRIGGRRIVTRSLSSAEAWHKALSTFIATTIRLPSIRLPDSASLKDAEYRSRLAVLLSTGTDIWSEYL